MTISLQPVSHSEGTDSVLTASAQSSMQPASSGCWGVVTFVTAPFRLLFHTPGFLYHAPRIFFGYRAPTIIDGKAENSSPTNSPDSQKTRTTTPASESVRDAASTKEISQERKELNQALSMAETTYQRCHSTKESYETAKTNYYNELDKKENTTNNRVSQREGGVTSADNAFYSAVKNREKKEVELTRAFDRFAKTINWNNISSTSDDLSKEKKIETLKNWAEHFRVINKYGTWLGFSASLQEVETFLREYDSLMNSKT